MKEKLGEYKREMENELHLYAANLLNQGKVNEAWQVLLALA